MSSAFHTIDHNILLNRLTYLYGISGTSWFCSYLSSRSQSVAIANLISPTNELHCGVFLGSVLGPILFVLYIQPFSLLIKQRSLSVHLFADDIQIDIQILSIDATKILLSAFVLPILDYCNSHFYCSPMYMLEGLEKVKNSAARLNFQCHKHISHFTPSHVSALATH